MALIELYPEQKEAVDKLHPGSILCGEVGSGKTLTALYYYKTHFPLWDLRVITTAKKRDSKDWEKEALLLGIESDIIVDSWNNIGKYRDERRCFFIFDEQKVSGYKKWAKTFIYIATHNKWILLSATPGDTWMDYISVFVANGFYRNKTDFVNQHVEYNRFVKYPVVKKYHNIHKLFFLRKKVVVPLKSRKRNRRNRIYHWCKYDVELYNKIRSTRFNCIENKPIENASQYVQLLRRVVGESQDRIDTLSQLLVDMNKAIIFYNYNYELDIIINVCKQLNITYTQWNGRLHEDIPDSDSWVYICHFAASEGWNCISTDTIIFYSLNYSYKAIEQAEGRIDRLNTPYENLKYHYLVSYSSIDKSIMKAIRDKKKFNESMWEDTAE